MVYSDVSSRIANVRRFNRFYTKILGLLGRHILYTRFSLTEARVLFEIGDAAECTATMLAETLEIDRGYLSRILKGFEGQGLVSHKKSPVDARSRLIHLTEEGRAVFESLNRASDRQIGDLLGALPERQQSSLLACMSSIEEILSRKPGSDELSIRTHRLGDAGCIASLHGSLYARDYGFDATFESYVLSGLADFLVIEDQENSRLWVAEVKGRIVGSIGIVRVDASTAQLRWLLIEPEFRGRGVGKKLINIAMDFCRERKYRCVYLWTTSRQAEARNLYQGAGFQLTDEKSHDIWGQNLIEERWRLAL